MKLSMLHEYVDLAKSSHDFYGDPASKAKKLNVAGGDLPEPGSSKQFSKNQPGDSKKDNDDKSHLVGQKADRNRWLKKTSPKRN